MCFADNKPNPRPSKYLSSGVYSLPRVCGVAALSAERLEILVEVCAVDDRVDAAVEHGRQQHDVRHQGPHLLTVISGYPRMIVRLCFVNNVFES